MQRTSTTSINLAHAGLAALLAWNVWRAVTQSVTAGEALNYDGFIGPEWKESLARFDSNNHFLNTLLVRISTWRIHLTEFSLRLPSLVFGALYLVAVYRLARRWFGSGALFLAVVGLLVLNPLVVDAMSEARGYGMALAAWMWALEVVTREEDAAGAWVGVLLGLSVAASLAFAAPAVALIVTIYARRAERKPGPQVPQVAFLTAFVLLAVPLNHAEMSVVTEGAGSLRQTLNELAAASLGSGNAVLAAAVRVGVGILAAAGLALGVFRRKTSAILYVSGTSLVLCLALMLAAHRFAHAAFPEGGALYLVPLVSLFVAAMIGRWGGEAAQFTFVAIAALCVGSYVNQLRPAYRGATGVEGGRQLAQALRAGAQNHGVSIGASADAVPVIRFYRWRYRQANWETIEALRPGASYSYYVLTAADSLLVRERGLHVVYSEPGLTLAQ